MLCDMELWTEVRRRVLTVELGKRAACQEYKLHWQTLEKILKHTEPPGYRRTKARPRPKMERFLPIIVEILEADRRAPRKQRHTAKRIFDRLVDHSIKDRPRPKYQNGGQSSLEIINTES